MRPTFDATGCYYPPNMFRHPGDWIQGAVALGAVLLVTLFTARWTSALNATTVVLAYLLVVLLVAATSRLRVALATSEAEITRVPVGREVAEAPPVRQDGDVLVIPVLEEVAVIERRLVLREEVRIRMRSATDTVEVPVTLRRQHATVERQPADPNPTAGPTPAPGEDEAHD